MSTAKGKSKKEAPPPIPEVRYPSQTDQDIVNGTYTINDTDLGLLSRCHGWDWGLDSKSFTTMASGPSSSTRTDKGSYSE